MKNAIRFLIFASALLAVALAYPEGRSSGTESDEDFEKVGPILVLSEGPDYLGDGFGSGFFNTGGKNPFNGFLSSVQDMMNKLRQRIAQSIPTYSDQGGFFGLSNIPEGANTTSTTKVINGHVVTVNETTYSDGDDEQGTVIRVRIVDIKPEDDEIIRNPEAEDITATPDSTTEVLASSNTDRSVESIENDIKDNEIPERLVTLSAA